MKISIVTDYVFIGANEDQAENIVKTLSISEENNKSTKLEPCNYRYIKSLLKIKLINHYWSLLFSTHNFILNLDFCFYRISDKVNILKTGEKQLDLIKAFLTYCRLRLREERINTFVDVDKALSSSQILCIAADAVLKEINEAELKLKELQAVIVTVHIKLNKQIIKIKYFVV